MAYGEIAAPARRFGWRVALVLAIVALLSARAVARVILEYQWWGELGQRSVWFSVLSYGVAPLVVSAVVVFAVFWIAHSIAVRQADARPSRMYNRISAAVLLAVSVLAAVLTIDSWTVIRYFGSQGAADAAWRDPVFQKPLSFFFFDLPFFSLLRRLLVAVSLGAAVIYWLTARFWQIREQFPNWKEGAEIDIRMLRLEGSFESRFLRAGLVMFLLALALRFYLGRYEMLWDDHGFMVGVDWVAETITLPLQWLIIAWSIAAAVLVWLGRWILAASLVAGLALQAIVPWIVSVVYVRPNEITIQRSYIDKHIQATRSAFGLDRRAREVEFTARLEGRIEPSRHKPLLDNIRLWDWRAFHDTTTQIQALRPYYVFHDTDVDRYTIDGQLRQVLLSPRELDIRQITDARSRWPISRFFYTHGYGMVMAEANRITPDGLPLLFVQDAPAKVKTASLKLTRPEIYYGEVTHEPVFVRTGQEEFNYPSGNENVLARYEGDGGFPVSSFAMRFTAALAEADVNIILTNYLTAESRMMIRRDVRTRLSALAGFVTWDSDPYLVLTDDGRLMWTLDGYTTSSSHPYARRVNLRGLGNINYIRNTVKATVDAYNGHTRLYVFDPDDPIIRAYQRLFPSLLRPKSEMPADLRRHARYPEVLFRVQAEIYRTYHMRDPQAFYNKEDIWSIARNIHAAESQPQEVAPTYVVATLPGGDKPEFLLMLPFTPFNKDNMIGLMVARCDGDNLGELTFLHLSKQALIFGPMQIEARINQDQNISKDLTLWNQQGSQVLRGQMLVLPVDDTFLYVEPIYIQASEARMPQLKKVVLAVGNQLIYRDTYEQALADLADMRGPASGEAAAKAETTAGMPARASPAAPATDQRVETIRQHLERYRTLAAQGKWAEAGKELESVERLVRR